MRFPLREFFSAFISGAVQNILNRRGNFYRSLNDFHRYFSLYCPIAKELTALAVESLKKKGDGLYAVGGAAGLYLQIVGNSRLWILRAIIAGRRRDRTLRIGKS